MSKRNSIPKLRFRGFDDDWKNFKFPDIIIKSNQGVNTTTEKVEYSNSGYTVIRSNNIYENYISFNDVKYVDEQTFKKIKFTCKPQKGDILYCNIGSALGSAALYLLNEDVIINWNVFRIQPNLSIVDNFFLTQELNRIRKTMRRYATESTMPFISSKAFNFIKFNIPTLPEQQKIASFLSAVDEKIQQLSRKKELLEQYKKGVMQQLFSGKLRFKDENGKDYSEWKDRKFGDVLNLQLREILKPHDNYLAIGIRSHVKGTFQKPDSDPSKIAMDKLFVVKENDLIVNITFAWEGAIAIAKKEDDGGLVSHRFPTYTFNSRYLLREYFAQVIIDKRLRMILDLISPGGAGRNRVLSKKEFLKIDWSFPCIEEQEKIANFLSSIDSKIESTSQQMNQTQSFKKGLLQQLFV